jgi:hypothetical protein
MVLPFLLVFVVVFAILQKTKILGADKKQIDSMASLIIGLLCISLPISRNFIINFMPWLAVGLAVLLVFFILYGFVAGDLSSMPNGLKITFGILAGVFTIGVLLYITGLWLTIAGWFGSPGNGFWLSTVLVVLVVGAIVWIVFGQKSA